MTAFIEYAWTTASVFAVLLSLWAIRRAFRVRGEMRKDHQAMLAKNVTNGRMLFASQQEGEGKDLFGAHVCVLTHQILFLLIGIYAIHEQDAPPPVGTPLLEAVGVPVAMLLAQYIILAGQIFLVRVTFGQEKWLRESREERSSERRTP